MTITMAVFSHDQNVSITLVVSEPGLRSCKIMQIKREKNMAELAEENSSDSNSFRFISFSAANGLLEKYDSVLVMLASVHG